MQKHRILEMLITYAIFRTFEGEQVWLVKTEGLRKAREERRWSPPTREKQAKKWRS